MRKIETQMCDAICNNENWQSANTTVVTQQDGVSFVYLHGNKIAELGFDYVQIFDGDHQTAITKSRLNALCKTFCVKGEGVFQKDFTWYVKRFVGKINGQDVFKTTLFTNGYTF
jgi:hypothetical protein